MSQYVGFSMQSGSEAFDDGPYVVTIFGVQHEVEAEIWWLLLSVSMERDQLLGVVRSNHVH